MFITRQEYDRLIKDYPEYMRDFWPKLKRKWSLRGVHVKGNINDLQGLSRRIFFSDIADLSIA